MSVPTWKTDINILRNAIFVILNPVLKDQQEHINKLFDEESTRKYWIPAFTHKDANPDSNYELLEAYGDKALDYCLNMYARAIFGDANLSESLLTLIRGKYAAKSFQAEMARKLGMTKLIDIGNARAMTKDIEEDALEAFFGAVNCVADDRLGMGMGFIYCYNLLVHLFSEFKIQITDIKKDDKTILKEMYEAMGFANPVYQTQYSQQPQYGAMQSVVLTKEGAPITGIVYGVDKSAAELAASTKALEVFASRGITFQTESAKKKQRELEQQPELKKQTERAERGIVMLNQEAQRTGKIPISSYNISKVSQVIDGKGHMQYTYSLDMMFARPDGGMDSRSFGKKTGNNALEIKIQLLADFANSMGVQ